MDGRCETCRYWAKRDDHPYVYGSCAVAWADGNMPGRTFVALTPMFVNASDPDAELLTRPDFGCTEWESLPGVAREPVSDG